MEESPVSKRSILQPSAEKSPIPHTGPQSPPAILAGVIPLVLTEFDSPRAQKISFVPAAPSIASAGRGPPARSLV